jgi:hypothetical protein
VNILICRCMEHGGKAMTMLRGMQGAKPPLPRVWGVSPNFLIFPQEWGTKGVDALDTQDWTPTTSPSCCKNRHCMLYIRRAYAVVKNESA